MANIWEKLSSMCATTEENENEKKKNTINSSGDAKNNVDNSENQAAVADQISDGNKNENKHDRSPAVEQFVIPKRNICQTELLLAVKEDSREFQHDILPYILQNYRKDLAQSKSSFKYSKPCLVQNKKLEQEFLDKKKEFRQAGYSDKEVKESYGFLFVDGEQDALKLCREGIMVSNLKSSCLGHSDMGVQLCKHADVIRPFKMNSKYNGYLVMFKIMKGKVKLVVENNSSIPLEPTPNFNCHVAVNSDLKYTSSPVDMVDLFKSSQIYIYEYGEESVLERPRQVNPFAVVKVSYMPKQTRTARQNGNSSAITKQVLSSPKMKTSLPVKEEEEFVVWNGQLTIKGLYACYVCMKSAASCFKPAKLGKEINISHKIDATKVKQKYLRNVEKLQKKNEELCGHYYVNVCELHPSKPEGKGHFEKVMNYFGKHNYVAVQKLEKDIILLLLTQGELSFQLGLSRPHQYPTVLYCLFLSKNSRRRRSSGDDDVDKHDLNKDCQKEASAVAKEEKEKDSENASSTVKSESQIVNNSIQDHLDSTVIITVDTGTGIVSKEESSAVCDMELCDTEDSKIAVTPPHVHSRSPVIPVQQGISLVGLPKQSSEPCVGKPLFESPTSASSSMCMVENMSSPKLDRICPNVNPEILTLPPDLYGNKTVTKDNYLVERDIETMSRITDSYLVAMNATPKKEQHTTVDKMKLQQSPGTPTLDEKGLMQYYTTPIKAEQLPKTVLSTYVQYESTGNANNFSQYQTFEDCCSREENIHLPTVSDSCESERSEVWTQSHEKTISPPILAPYDFKSNNQVNSAMEQLPPLPVEPPPQTPPPPTLTPPPQLLLTSQETPSSQPHTVQSDSILNQLPLEQQSPTKTITTSCQHFSLCQNEALQTIPCTNSIKHTEDLERPDTSKDSNNSEYAASSPQTVISTHSKTSSSQTVASTTTLGQDNVCSQRSLYSSADKTSADSSPSSLTSAAVTTEQLHPLANAPLIFRSTATSPNFQHSSSPLQTSPGLSSVYQLAYQASLSSHNVTRSAPLLPDPVNSHYLPWSPPLRSPYQMYGNHYSRIPEPFGPYGEYRSRLGLVRPQRMPLLSWEQPVYRPIPLVQCHRPPLLGIPPTYVKPLIQSWPQRLQTVPLISNYNTSIPRFVVNPAPIFNMDISRQFGQAPSEMKPIQEFGISSFISPTKAAVVNKLSPKPLVPYSDVPEDVPAVKPLVPYSDVNEDTIPYENFASEAKPSTDSKTSQEVETSLSEQNDIHLPDIKDLAEDNTSFGSESKELCGLEPSLYEEICIADSLLDCQPNEIVTLNKHDDSDHKKSDVLPNEVIDLDKFEDGFMPSPPKSSIIQLDIIKNDFKVQEKAHDLHQILRTSPKVKVCAVSIIDSLNIGFEEEVDVKAEPEDKSIEDIIQFLEIDEKLHQNRSEAGKAKDDTCKRTCKKNNITDENRNEVKQIPRSGVNKSPKKIRKKTSEVEMKHSSRKEIELMQNILNSNINKLSRKDASKDYSEEVENMRRLLNETLDKASPKKAFGPSNGGLKSKSHSLQYVKSTTVSTCNEKSDSKHMKGSLKHARNDSPEDSAACKKIKLEVVGSDGSDVEFVSSAPPAIIDLTSPVIDLTKTPSPIRIVKTVTGYKVEKCCQRLSGDKFVWDVRSDTSEKSGKNIYPTSSNDSEGHLKLESHFKENSKPNSVSDKNNLLKPQLTALKKNESKLNENSHTKSESMLSEIKKSNVDLKNKSDGNIQIKDKISIGKRVSRFEDSVKSVGKSTSGTKDVVKSNDNKNKNEMQEKFEPDSECKENRKSTDKVKTTEVQNDLSKCFEGEYKKVKEKQKIDIKLKIGEKSKSSSDEKAKNHDQNVSSKPEKDENNERSKSREKSKSSEPDSNKNRRSSESESSKSQETHKRKDEKHSRKDKKPYREEKHSRNDKNHSRKDEKYSGKEEKHSRRDEKSSGKDEKHSRKDEKSSGRDEKYSRKDEKHIEKKSSKNDGKDINHEDEKAKKTRWDMVMKSLDIDSSNRIGRSGKRKDSESDSDTRSRTGSPPVMYISSKKSKRSSPSKKAASPTKKVSSSSKWKAKPSSSPSKRISVYDCGIPHKELGSFRIPKVSSKSKDEKKSSSSRRHEEYNSSKSKEYSERERLHKTDSSRDSQKSRRSREKEDNRDNKCKDNSEKRRVPTSKNATDIMSFIQSSLNKSKKEQDSELTSFHIPPDSQTESPSEMTVDSNDSLQDLLVMSGEVPLEVIDEVGPDNDSLKDSSMLNVSDDYAKDLNGAIPVYGSRTKHLSSDSKRSKSSPILNMSDIIEETGQGGPKKDKSKLSCIDNFDIDSEKDVNDNVITSSSQNVPDASLSHPVSSSSNSTTVTASHVTNAPKPIVIVDPLDFEEPYVPSVHRDVQEVQQGKQMRISIKNDCPLHRPVLGYSQVELIKTCIHGKLEDMRVLTFEESVMTKSVMLTLHKLNIALNFQRHVDKTEISPEAGKSEEEIIPGLGDLHLIEKGSESKVGTEKVEEKSTVFASVGSKIGDNKGALEQIKTEGATPEDSVKKLEISPIRGPEVKEKEKKEQEQSRENSNKGPIRSSTSRSHRQDRQHHPYSRKEKRYKGGWSFDINYTLNEIMQNLSTCLYKERQKPATPKASRPRFSSYRFRRSSIPEFLPDERDDIDLTRESIPDFDERKKKAELLDTLTSAHGEDEPFTAEQTVYDKDAEPPKDESKKKKASCQQTTDNAENTDFLVTGREDVEPDWDIRVKDFIGKCATKKSKRKPPRRINRKFKRKY